MYIHDCIYVQCTCTSLYKIIAYSLQRQHDGDERQNDHGQEAVAENADDLTQRHAADAHHAEQAVHRQAAQHADAVDIAELHLARLRTCQTYKTVRVIHKLVRVTCTTVRVTQTTTVRRASNKPQHTKATKKNR